MSVTFILRTSRDGVPGGRMTIHNVESVREAALALAGTGLDLELVDE
jgi:hypothetical protein